MGRTAVNQDQAKLDVRFAGASAARARQAVLQPGMVLAFEPNACIGHHRVNIGGTVIVTATGCEELNHIATGVTHKQ
jgi:Xaa-Pro aminopeptidase